MISVSVIITTYNYAHYIVNAIESVLSQTYSNSLIQIIVIDDGSKDDTRKGLNNYIEQHIIEYYFQENQGKASATSLGIQKAKGEIIFNLDADDEFLPNKINSIVEVYQQYPHVALVASPAKIVLSDGTYSEEILPAFLLDKVNDGKDVLANFLENDILFGGGSTYSARASILKNIIIPEDADMYIDELLVYATLLKGDVYFKKNALSTWNVHGFNYSGSENNTIQLIAKTNRLEKSSSGVLTYLINQKTPSSLIMLYQLKHNIRLLSFKEQLSNKKLNDIISFIQFLIQNNSIPIKTLYKYNAIQRIIPTKLLYLVKQVLPKRN